MDSQKDKLLHLFKLLRLGFGEYKWQIAVLAILSFFGGILEGIGVTAIIPLFSFFNGDANDADVISSAIKKFFLYFQLSFSIQHLLIFVAVLFLGKAIFLLVSNYLTAVIRRNYELEIRGSLFNFFLESGWPYLSRQKVGHLDVVLITDVHLAAAMLPNLSAFILTGVNLIIYTLLVVNIAPWVAVLSLVFGVAAYFIFKPWSRKTRAAAGESARIDKDIAHYINENIIGMKAIKSLFVEKEIFRKGIDYFKRSRDLCLKMDMLQNITSVSLQTMGIFFILALFTFFHKTSGINLAAFAVIVYAVNRVFAGIQSIQSGIYALNSYSPHLASVLKYKKEAKENREADGGRREFKFKDSLQFQKVNFSYDYDNERALLASASFSIKKGEMSGLIGPSGAGKTTIVDLLLRLLKPRSGQILLDGEDISGISLKEWRTNVGYVSQDIFLINDTIFNNIRFYNDHLSYEEVVEAAKMANIYDFIESQPKKLETVVGERGIRLSGGQRQRIVLARVLARKPKILILDEATSALDNESEIAVQKAIAGLRGKVTVLAIAHRLSTVINSDHLIVLESGRIVEQGEPGELLKDKESYFSKVYNLRK